MGNLMVKDYYNIAKKVGKLSNETIIRAKKLGISGRSLLGLVNSTKREKWKEPVDSYIRKIYERKFNENV